MLQNSLLLTGTGIRGYGSSLSKPYPVDCNQSSSSTIPASSVRAAVFRRGGHVCSLLGGRGRGRGRRQVVPLHRLAQGRHRTAREGTGQERFLEQGGQEEQPNQTLSGQTGCTPNHQSISIDAVE